MFIVAPFGEERQIVEYILRIGMEDVRAVFVNQNAGLIVMIVGVAADMGTPIHQHHALTEVASHLSGNHGSGKTCANNNVIKHEPRSPVPFSRVFLNQDLGV